MITYIIVNIKKITKYAVKYLDENNSGLNNSKKLKNNEPISCEINGSYAEFNKQSKASNLSKNNSKKLILIKKD